MVLARLMGVSFAEDLQPHLARSGKRDEMYRGMADQISPQLSSSLQSGVFLGLGAVTAVLALLLFLIDKYERTGLTYWMGKFRGMLIVE